MATKDVPRHALRFTLPVCEFGSNGDAAKTAPVKMLARSGQPIEHWYWGRVVHDLDGMVLTKPRIAIDYCHDDSEILGYINKFDTDTGDLVLSGAITPFEPTDRASEVLFKGQEGVPYEASIDFCGDGIQIQQVAPGEVADVNGYQFEGPGIIIRQWPLRGVAVCPHGADANTSTQFKNDPAGGKPVSVTLFTKESPVDKQNTAEAGNTPAVDATTKTTPTTATEAPPAGAVELTAGAGKPAEGAKPPVDANVPKPDHKAFVAAFGDKGALWFLEGKSFPDATTEFVGSLRAEHETAVTALKAGHQKEVDGLNAQIATLTQKLDGAKLGNDPVTFQSATPDKQAQAANKYSGKLPENLAKVAAATKMPGQPRE